MNKIGVKMLFKLGGLARKKNAVIIFSPYFSEEKMTDGFFRRVKVSDSLMSSIQKIYFDFENHDTETSVRFPDTNTAVIRFGRVTLWDKFIAAFLLMICHRVYCESVWQVRKRILSIPFIKVYVDVHGAVPEEEFLYGKYSDAQKYGDVEAVVVRKAAHLFCVTQAMIDHFKEKYGDAFKASASVLPIFDEELVAGGLTTTSKPLIKGKPLITYAGGIFKWQKIEAMQSAMVAQPDIAVYQIYTPTPDKFWATWEGKRQGISVRSTTPAVLTSQIYPKCHYGFALRDDIVVNNVACPTKIPEYLKFGIIPILDTPNIGDFTALGMKYLALEDFLAGKLYSEKEMQEIVENNYRCVEKYIETYKAGERTFKKVMLGETHA